MIPHRSLSILRRSANTKPPVSHRRWKKQDTLSFSFSVIPWIDQKKKGKNGGKREKDLRRMREIEKTQILPFSGTTLTNSGLKGAAKTLTTHTAISYVLYEITIILIIDK